MWEGVEFFYVVELVLEQAVNEVFAANVIVGGVVVVQDWVRCYLKARVMMVSCLNLYVTLS